MGKTLKRSGGARKPGDRLGCAACFVNRITLLTLIAVTMLAQFSASAQTTLRLRDGFVGEDYTFSFADVVNGEGKNAEWTVVDPGKLPTGLILSSGGLLSGAPRTLGSNEFEVVAKIGDAVTFKTKVLLKIVAASFDNNQLILAGAATAVEEKTCDPQESKFLLASSTADEETVALTEEASMTTMAALNTNTLKIEKPDLLINTTLGKRPDDSSRSVFKEGDYTIIHIIKWKVKEMGEKTDPEKELWALYESVNDSSGLKWEERMNPDNKEIFDTRIFGSRRVAVLMLHLDTPRTWDVKYKVSVNRRVPQPIQNVLQLAGFFGGSAPLSQSCIPKPTRNIWGGRMMIVRHMASNIVVNLNAVTANDIGQPISQSKEHSNSYLNEGRYYWDVSLGLPVNSIKELEFSAESGVITARKKDRQNAYAFLNLFPRAVDLSGKSYLTSPHFVFGVPLSSKPLDRPIVGVGTGLYTEQFKINFFAGVAFNKVSEPKTLSAGQAASAGQLENDLETRRVAKFVFGVNFPVKQFIDAIKGSK